MAHNYFDRNKFKFTSVTDRDYQENRIIKKLTDDADNGQLYHELGLIHWDRFDFEKAVSNIKKALEIDDGLIEAYISMAIILREMRLFREAKEYLNADILLSQPGLQWKLLMEHALCYFEEKRINDSYVTFEKSLILAPEEGELLYNYGVVLFNQQKYSIARYYFEKAMISESHAMLANHFLLAIRLKQRKFLELNYYHLNSSEIGIPEHDLRVFIQKGLIYRENKEWELSEKMFRKALGLKPGCANILYYLALLETSKNEKDKAVEFLKESFSSDSFFIKSGLLLINLLCSLQRFDEADNYLDELRKIKLPSIQSQTYLRKGILFVSQNKVESSIEEFQKAIKIDPHNAEAHSRLGLSYFYQQEYQKAQGEFKEAMYYDNLRPEPYLYISKILQINGNNREAIGYLKKLASVEKQQKKWLAYYELSLVYKKLNDQRSLQKYLLKARDCCLNGAPENLPKLAHLFEENKDYCNSLLCCSDIIDRIPEYSFENPSSPDE